MPETPLDGTDEQWDEGWERTLRVNVLEPASLVREAVNHFVANGGGTLIGLSSWAAERGSAIPQLTAYAASKAAVRNLIQTIARNHARDGVLAYVVAPGIVRTPLSEISATLPRRDRRRQRRAGDGRDGRADRGGAHDRVPRRRRRAQPDRRDAGRQRRQPHPLKP